MKAALSLLVVSIAMVAAYPQRPVPYKRPVNVPTHRQQVPVPTPRHTTPQYTTPRPIRPYHPPPKPYHPAPTPHHPAPKPYRPAPTPYHPAPKPYRPAPKPYHPAPKPYYPTWSSWTSRPSTKPWWYGKTSLGRPVIGVTKDGRPITDATRLSEGRRSIFSQTRTRAGVPTPRRFSESHSSGDSISFENHGPRIPGVSDQSSFSRSSESWESRSDEDRPTRRRVRLITDHLGRHMIELVPSSESNSSGDSISHEDTWFGPYGSYSASSGSQSSSQDVNGR